MPYFCGIGPLLQPHYEGGLLSMRSISDTGKDHITISYRITPFEETDTLAYWPNRIEVEVMHETMLGAHEDIPAYLVRFVDEKVAEEMHKFRLHTEIRQPDEFHPPYFTPHITRKHLNGPLAPGDRLWAACIFIKQVGVDVAPLYERKLTPIPHQD